MAQFVKSLDGTSRIAFYSYSRNLSRAASLTPLREDVLRGIRSTVNGADSALYNCMLLTLHDAAKVAGKKVMVVFTNGPDNSSTVSPEEVAELAQSVGVPVYMISTREARIDPVSSVVFTRMSANTGGTAYFAKNWRDEDQAFSAIREDLTHLYVLSYYPQANPNRGWRKITVKLNGKNLSRYMVRTRSGYRPILESAFAPAGPAANAE
jgi:VWFA-related protein